MALDLTKPAFGNPTGSDLDAIRANFVALDATDTAHAAATAAHGVAGAVVGTTDAQTLTNKTIVAASNTITTAASGDLSATELNAALAELQAAITALESTVGGLGAVEVYTDYINTTAGISTGTGEDAKYYDVDMTAYGITDYTRCRAEFIGGWCSSSVANGGLTINDGDQTNPTMMILPRLTSNTNLRLSFGPGAGSYSVASFIGRWVVTNHGA